MARLVLRAVLLNWAEKGTVELTWALVELELSSVKLWAGPELVTLRTSAVEVELVSRPKL